jgi:SAM-dependent methyltransferase
MEFSGERVIPGQVDPDLWNEHVSRYAFASRLVGRLPAGKRGRLRVLDAGCGTGYGTALLAAAAPGLKAVGIDISEEALAWAAGHYAAPNLRFQQGDCLALPFADHEFGVVVAFEIIEHLADAAGFLKEAARVLAPAGLLIASTPNRRYYSEERGYANPFHTREYDAEEFDRLLEPFFSCRVTFVQNHAPAISFFPVNRSQAGAARAEAGLGTAEATPAAAAAAPDEPHFLVALASRQQVPAAQPYVFVPSSANVLRQRETHIGTLERELAGSTGVIRQLQQEHEETVAWARGLDSELSQTRQVLEARQQEHEEAVTWARGLESELSQAREVLEARQQELDERTLWTQQLDREVQRLENLAAGLQRELKTRTEWAVSLDEDLGRARRELDKRDRELIEKVDWARSLEADLERARQELDQRDRELTEKVEWARALQGELNKTREVLGAHQREHEETVTWARRLEGELSKAREVLEARQQELDERILWAQQLDREIQRMENLAIGLQAERAQVEADLQAEREQRTAERERLEATVEERTAWALRLDAEAESLRADMRLILGSIWYRLGKKLRLGPVPRVDRERGKQ